MSTSYGPEPHGLVCGFLLSPNASARAIGLQDALACLQQTTSDEQGFVWLHFSLTDASAVQWMQANLPLAPEFFDALKEGSRSTRIEDARDNLIAVVNDVAYEFAFDASEISTLWVSVTQRLAVSARVHPSRSIDRLREDVKKGARIHSSVALLNHLLTDQGDVLVRIVRKATLEVDEIEDSLLHGRVKAQRVQLGQLRRVLVRLQRLLAPEPAALFRLLRQPPPWIELGDLEELRQSTEEFSLVIRDVAALQERIKLLQEEIAAQVSEQTNRSIFTLTVVTVLALPINITTGLFGMNVGGIPLAEERHGFIALVLIIAVVTVVTVVAAWIAFRKRD